MSAVELHGVVAGYGSHGVLDGIELSVAEGTMTAVLGGSGSGKTTLLRVVAGFLRPRSGTVQIGGRTVTGPSQWVAPERRGIGYVRQDGGLFPHLDVAGNVAFGLPRRQRRQRDRVLELLELVDLPESVADRRPDQLSGGQQQRVSLARALAPRPELVLLDEPFSSLDTALREATRGATARALRAARATAILVTHDQGEALSFADEVAVLRDGHFRQVAAPREIYGAPVDPHVAAFLGDAVLVPGQAAAGHVECALGSLSVAGFVPHGAVDVMVRPEQILLSPHGDAPVKAMVTSVAYFGHDAVVQLELQTGPGVAPAPSSDRQLRARIVGLQPPEVGEMVGLTVVGPVRVFPQR